MQKPFWEKPLNQLTKYQWEQLCDGCGLCCIEKVEDDNYVYYTKVICDLLDKKTGKCTNYKNRQKLVFDCVDLQKIDLSVIDWLPNSCAYVLRTNNKPLPKWHPLIDKTGEYNSKNPNKLFTEHKMIFEKEMLPNKGFESYLLKKVND